MAQAPSAIRAPHAMGSAEIAARMAIRHLLDAYCHAIDRRDYALLASLYHPDATDDHTPYYTGSAAGFVEWLPQMMDGTWAATSHTITNCLLLIDGDRAEGEICTRAWHLTLDRATQFTAWGRYCDRYEQRDGVWRFAHRSLVLDHAETTPAAPLGEIGTSGVGLGAAGTSDPVYDRLPLFGADRARSPSRPG